MESTESLREWVLDYLGKLDEDIDRMTEEQEHYTDEDIEAMRARRAEVSEWLGQGLGEREAPDRFDQYIEAGRKLILAHPDAPEAEEYLTDDLWTYASDQIATILHGLFGRTPVDECDARPLLAQAHRCWEGDYEDMGTEPYRKLPEPDPPEAWTEPLREMGGYRHDG